MYIKKLLIQNYKRFKFIEIDMNPDTNIFVGENDSGKTTILEALIMVLTGKINGAPILSRLNADWFNNEVRNQYIAGLENGQHVEPPCIMIEACIDGLTDADLKIKNYRGANNFHREDAVGIRIIIALNEEYSATYKDLVAAKKVADIPVELYKISFFTFAGPDYYINATTKKVACIDTTRKDYGTALNRFVSSSISDYLTDDEQTQLRLAYRGNRHDFTQSEAVKSLNQKIQENHQFGNHSISINLRENDIDSWKSEMSVSVDSIPLENVGFGTQNMFKSEIFIQQNPTVDILVMEEPENNLSHTNMSILVSKLARNTGKQLFVSTHSSFVANKLGLNHLHLVGNGIVIPLSNLDQDTYNYFLKLPGYNTLRLLLANNVILVEGPADELIVQRAYHDEYGRLPIEDGIDVIAVGGVAFKRYCELAMLIEKKVSIITDNDNNASEVKERYAEFGDIVALFIDEDNEHNTLEPSVFAANAHQFETFRDIVYHGAGKDKITPDQLQSFMTKNKTEWSMRVFQSESNISYPIHIRRAIGCVDDE